MTQNESEKNRQAEQLLHEIKSGNLDHLTLFERFEECLYWPGYLEVAFCMNSQGGGDQYAFLPDTIRALTVLYDLRGVAGYVENLVDLRDTSHLQHDLARVNRLICEIAREIRNRREITFALTWRFAGFHAREFFHSADRTAEQAFGELFDEFICCQRMELELDLFVAPAHEEEWSDE